jgi:MFS family permease
MIRASAALAPFQVRSFRFQWPADLLTSWAFEMETLILGWYVLVETQSVFLLSLFGSLSFFGTLIAPMVGVIADRVGRRTVLCTLRATYALLALALMALSLSGAMSPLYVFAIAAIGGTVRPSDQVMRNALVGDTMPADRLMGAMALARSTQDSARIAGALTGAALFAALGMTQAYIAIAAFYATSFLLTLGVARHRPAAREAALPTSHWHELKDGMVYVWTRPTLLALMWLAFLVNLTAFPLSQGLLPHVAKTIYQVDQTGLSFLTAGWAFGALLGSLAMTVSSWSNQPTRTMLVGAVLWYVVLLVFAQTGTALSGFFALIVAGFVQNFAMIAMAVALLHAASGRFRGRVMGVRMLAVYGLPIGLTAAGALVEYWGFAATATLYCAVGLVFTLLIAVRWSAQLWRAPAAAAAE